jgi:photosystem II stability/assembly factor-like uncharacterized protein
MKQTIQIDIVFLPGQFIIAVALAILSNFFPHLVLSQTPIWEPTASIQGGAISPLFVDSTGVIFAGTTYQGMYRSTNRGTSWELANSGQGGRYVFDFGVDRNNNVLVTTDFGLYRSSDHGAQWRLVRVFFQPFSVATNSAGHLFVGCEQDWGVGDFYRSTDDGSTWVRLQLPR